MKLFNYGLILVFLYNYKNEKSKYCNSIVLYATHCTSNYYSIYEEYIFKMLFVLKALNYEKLLILIKCNFIVYIVHDVMRLNT